MTSFGPPYYDLRVGPEIRRIDVFEIGLRFENLMRIDLHPPASGPEIELTFGTPVGAPVLALEAQVKIVERELQAPVLASREHATPLRRHNES